MRSTRLLPAVAALAFGLSAAAAAQSLEWPQWGGPTRDFKVPARGLAGSWPASGPKALWSRPLGEGYSAIAVDGGVLYTQYRPLKGVFTAVVSKFTGSDPEVVAALDASTGRTLWEHVYEAPLHAQMSTDYGPGPNATPLVAGDLVFAVGSTGKLHALDKKTGRVAWAKDLWGEMGGQVHGRGYSAEPRRLRREPDPPGGRRRPGARGLPAEGRPGRLEEAHLRRAPVLADAHQRRRPGPARPLPRRRRGGDGPERWAALLEPLRTARSTT